ncbi:MAG: tRNA dihydrouridine synthase DusB [Clostridia bacterium]|nr:tRNA dihydrouridine synthase DusB [Clostridia bacterium]MBO5914341.1 tRNA dihydrouridine synthase DusB [Clostridia bacterium]
MKIGNIEFRHGLFLAPMAGITDHPFRALCVKCGAEGVTSELISAKGAYYGDRKTEGLARVYPDERIAAIQIFGSDPDIMANAARLMLRYQPDYIDVNMGCPVPKLYKNGEGSALMRNPELCERIVREVSNAVSVPVTAKFRKACDDDRPEAAIEVALACESGGASAVFVHGRTRAQMYSGFADREIIKKVKQAVKIPVIGNGDVASYADFVAMKEETGCDGVMIGRGAYGSPWVFSEIVAGLEGYEYREPTNDEKRALLMQQLDAVCAEKGINGIREFRHHILQYCKGFSGSARMRKNISLITSRAAAEEAIRFIFG